jgi:drug/metabolite transporter (DMT)-like permease
MQLGAGAAALLLASLAVGELRDWTPAEITPRALLSLAFLVVGGTVLGFGAYTWLLRVTSAAAVSTYAFVNPVVALLLAWAVGDGELSVRTALAAALVVGAVVFSREPVRWGKRETTVLQGSPRGRLAATLSRSA